MDLMLGKKNNNIFYFLMDMFSKLQIHIGSVSICRVAKCELTDLGDC
jgi:hypothetical protein